MEKNLIKVSYRFLLIIISAIFIFSGVDKIVLNPEMIKIFDSFGLPKEMMVIVGFTELVLAVFLQTKYFTKLATHGLLTILFFGAFFHIMNGQFVITLIPLTLIISLFITLDLGHRIKNFK